MIKKIKGILVLIGFVVFAAIFGIGALVAWDKTKTPEANLLFILIVSVIISAVIFVIGLIIYLFIKKAIKSKCHKRIQQARQRRIQEYRLPASPDQSRQPPANIFSPPFKPYNQTRTPKALGLREMRQQRILL